MRKSILILMVCCVAAFALACSPTNNTATGNNTAGTDGGKKCAGTDGGKKDGGEVVDAMAIYKKKGNWWTTKTTAKKPMESVTFMKSEVTDVNDKEATWTMTMMDKDEKVTFEQKDQKMPLVAPKVEPAKDVKVEAPKTTEEEVECKAWGKVKATKMETEAGGFKTTTWMYKGVAVKTKTTGDNMESESELWATNLPK
ncbi:MAG: hypothetical protein IT462_05350 [Planctomycetes bacterium]|nr:hypothetical protein [Planctomycetota bacterium]